MLYFVKCLKKLLEKLLDFNANILLPAQTTCNKIVLNSMSEARTAKFSANINLQTKLLIYFHTNIYKKCRHRQKL